MVELIYLVLNLGFTIVFFFLGAAILLLHTPKEPGMKNYRICRGLLGTSYLVMSIYCIVRIVLPQNNADFGNFWFLVTFALLFAWLNYTAFLFIINSKKKVTRSVFIDGIIPLGLMGLTGGIGIIYPASQNILRIIFTVIYTAKCIYMFYKCLREWNMCNKDLNRHEKEYIDIRWMKVLLIVIFIYSLSALIAFYKPALNVILGPALIAVFFYQTFRIINLMPKQLDATRQNADKQTNTEKFEKGRDLAEKIQPKIDKWVMEKKFCRPEITIKEAAGEMGTNHNYLSAYINGYLNMTFQVWLNTLRIEEAKVLLVTEPKLSIEEIGTQVGIPQNYNFSRWFKLVTELTPYQYRRLNATRA